MIILSFSFSFTLICHINGSWCVPQSIPIAQPSPTGDIFRYIGLGSIASTASPSMLTVYDGSCDPSDQDGTILARTAVIAHVKWQALMHQTTFSVILGVLKGSSRSDTQFYFV